MSQTEGKSATPATTAQELESLRQRFRDFVDHASHDLHSPLRKLGVFVDKLLSDDTKKDNTDLGRRISSQLQKMRTIIDGFTELARVDGSPREMAMCDLNSVIKESLNEFNDEVEEGKLSTEVLSLPTIESDALRLKILFRNLIENAVKFSRPDAPVLLKIYSKISEENNSKTTEKKFHAIIFEDNGVGFNPEYAEKIFEPFKRMHTSANLPGNGLGLTICKRIVENMGGSIIAESDATTGARFVLILPETQSNH